MKKIIPFLSLAIGFAFTQCKKDSGSQDDGESKVNFTFLPITTGSYLNYKFSDGVTTTLYTTTNTGRDTSLSGGSRIYKVYKTNDATFNYFQKSGTLYYRFTSLPVIGQFDELYLKDSISNDDTWTVNLPIVDSLPGFHVVGPVTRTLTYTKLEEIPATVEGKYYGDVAKIKLDLKLSYTDQNTGTPKTQNIGSRESYYARGVGMIQETYDITVRDTVTTVLRFGNKTTLTGYLIK